MVGSRVVTSRLQLITELLAKILGLPINDCHGALQLFAQRVFFEFALASSDGNISLLTPSWPVFLLFVLRQHSTFFH
jgi:hypothetical protein